MSENDIKNVLDDLRLFGGCAVCKHCDKSKYPAFEYCKFGGCCGGGSGIIKEDKWEYSHDLNKKIR